MIELKMHTTFWYENQKGRDHLVHLGIDRRTILKRILSDRKDVRE
jgi:hypothetical protein